METRYIFIGDIHGCYDELIHLLDVVSPSPNDEVISLGDFLDRGPFPVESIEYWRDMGYKSVMGNHDYRLVEWSCGGKVPLAEGFEETKRLFTQRKDLISYVSKFPLTLYFKEIDSIAVHAALDVNKQSLEVDIDIAIRGRYVRRYRNNRFHYVELGKEQETDQLWVDYWKNKTKVFYGHTPTIDSKPLCTNNTVGLDTGCAYGKRLTAAIVSLSGGIEYVSVPAQRTYWRKAKKEDITII